MERLPKGMFTEEFKEEAVKMVTEGGLSVNGVANRLSIGKSTLGRWVKEAREGNPQDAAGKHKPVTAQEMELARLRKENAELRMEREILKKATAYFARESLPGTRS